MGPRALFPFALCEDNIEPWRVAMATPCARDKLGCPFRTELGVLLCRDGDIYRERVRLMCRVLGALFVNLNGK
jgi:hypothetical protein